MTTQVLDVIDWARDGGPFDSLLPGVKIPDIRWSNGDTSEAAGELGARVWYGRFGFGDVELQVSVPGVSLDELIGGSSDMCQVWVAFPLESVALGKTVLLERRRMESFIANYLAGFRELSAAVD
ncbi:hypothetical protein Poly30_35420 [Planctomycetes bacterium Poly30]|uniref:Uncharacterized protein n=2 Tax=Saltatorellus ferox TaxID=2528018 RepID=A0A518EV79_9BACT|nr:hypothetical protein Poly30_35420 [Planctomycetes bacterium Poly30]